MIQRQRKQLFRRFVYPLLICLIPLIVFFIYSARYQPNFFVLLTIVQFVIIAFLIPFRLQIVRKRAEVNLQKQDILERINLLRADILREKKLTESLREKIVNYTRLKDLTEQLAQSLAVNDATNTALSFVDNLFASEDIVKIIYLFEKRTGELGLSSSHKGKKRINIKTKKGDIYDEWVIKKMQSVLVEDARNDFRFDFEKVKSDDERPILSVISVPLMVGEKIIGILRLDSSRENTFDTDDLRFLRTIGDLAAMALENAHLYEREEQLAIKDGLTNLYLRRFLLDRLPEEMARHLKRDQDLSFLMIDLDEFKKYNDKYGHIAGDIVLKTVAHVLAEHARRADALVARYGGEEFAVLLPECPKPEAGEIAGELRKTIEQTEIVLRQKKTRITVSIGVASFPKDARLKEELIQKADSAMYRAKNKGRNRVCLS